MNSARTPTSVTDPEGAVDIVLPNQSDFCVRNPQYVVTGTAREMMVRFSGTYEPDHCIAWSTGARVLVLPEGYDRLWFADLHEQWGLSVPEVVTPRRRTGLLTRDLLDDAEAMGRLEDLVEGRRAKVLAFGPTAEVYELTDRLAERGVDVWTDSVAPQDYWLNSWLETKLSCLDLSRWHDALAVPDSVVVTDRAELEGMARWFLTKYERVVVRTPFGVAGDGMAIVRRGDDSLSEALEAVDTDPFFAFPLLVQEYVAHASEVGCPAADIFVGDDGVAEITYCAISVEEGHFFRSVDVGPGALHSFWAERLDALARDLGAIVHKMGYRGWFCVDTVAGQDGELYVTEINARRSGSTFAGSLLGRWPGAETTLNADFMVPVAEGLTYSDDIRPLFAARWARGERVYPTIIRALAWEEPMLAVLAVGDTAREARRVGEAVARELGALRPARVRHDVTPSEPRGTTGVSDEMS